MKNNLKELWNKIKPLDYEKNPIGSLKLEIFSWLSLIYVLTLYLSMFEVLYTFNFVDYYIPNWFAIIIVICAWMRIALKINIFIEKDKNEK